MTPKANPPEQWQGNDAAPSSDDQIRSVASRPDGGITRTLTAALVAEPAAALALSKSLSPDRRSSASPVGSTGYPAA